MPANNGHPVITAKSLPNNKVSLVISGDIGDDWDGENTTYNMLVNESGITDSTEHMDIAINTDGGSVNQGVAMYNFIKNHPATVRTTILGGAHSAGSILFLAGDERIMPSGTNAIIHNPWSCGCGDHNATTKLAGDLKTFTDSMIDIYMERMTVDRDDLVAMLDREEILSGQKALDTGFATSLVAPVETISKEEQANRIAEARAQVSASRACSLNKKNDGVVMTQKTQKETASADLPSREVLAAKAALLESEKMKISAKHDVLATLNASLTEEVTNLKAQLEEVTVSDEKIAEMVEAGVEARMSADRALVEVRATATSMGIQVVAESADEMKREVLAAKGVKNPEAFDGEALNEMFAYVADQYGSDEADDVYASVAKGSDKAEYSIDDSENAFAGVNAKMKRGA